MGRPVPGALSGRRLLLVCALVLLLPGALAAAALAHNAPTPPPAQAAVGFGALPQVPDAVLRAHLNRSQKVVRMTAKLTVPTLLDPVAIDAAGPGVPAAPAVSGSETQGALPTLALTPRAAPYTLDELHRLVPAAFADLAGQPGAGAPLVVVANLEVPLGATLVIDGRTPDVRLTSTPSGFATIISRGTVTISGDALRPVRISSWDPARGRVDADSTDGRSFVVQIGGRMDAEHAVFQYLGFNIGLSSGVAWSGASASVTQPQPVKAQGTVRSSAFLHNYFGAYTRRAEGMHWVDNTFAGNEQYGFDPHDFSNNFLVESNVAFGNGKHGFIFSQGCEHNILRGNVSHDNGGHGFMIDDGRSRFSTFAQPRISGSSGNVLTNNSAFANLGNGIEIEGGVANVVANNLVSGNYIGIRAKDDAMVEVRDNTAADNARYGIDVRNTTGGIPVAGNTISGSWGAINLASSSSAVLGENVATDVSAPLVVAGAAVRDSAWPDRIALLVRWNPMLVLWSVLLAVPIGVAVLRCLWTVRPKRQTGTG